MRTTLTVDPDVAERLRREIRRIGRSMKAVVNDRLRAGLGGEVELPKVLRYTVEPHAFGFEPGVDADRPNRLVDELEAEEIARRLDR